MSVYTAVAIINVAIISLVISGLYITGDILVLLALFFMQTAKSNKAESEK